GHDPAKVDALHAVAAGRLWVSVETTFQYIDSTSTVDTADEARTVELTRAIADALIELAPPVAPAGRARRPGPRE
ncbi:MAG TPA: hypothetical protein VGF17_26035, partial [Phytomonospora sp.]